MILVFFLHYQLLRCSIYLWIWFQFFMGMIHLGILSNQIRGFSMLLFSKKCQALFIWIYFVREFLSIFWVYILASRSPEGWAWVIQIYEIEYELHAKLSDWDDSGIFFLFWSILPLFWSKNYHTKYGHMDT